MRRFLAISLFLAACGQDDVQTDPVGQDTGDDTNASKTDIFIDQSQTPDAEIDMMFVDASTDASADMARPPSAEWTIHAGGSGVCALHETGRVKCWGGILGREVNGFAGDEPDEMGTNLPFINLGTDRTVKTMVAGGHVCAILDNDRLKCWGTNQYGQLGLGDMDERGRRPGEMGDDLPYVDLGTGRTVRQIAQSIFATCALLDMVA